MAPESTRENALRGVRAPLAALSFLTIVPVRRAPTLDDVSRAQAWFAAVGLAMGLALVGMDRLASEALAPGGVDVLLVVMLAAMTGALHLDGLADAADGLIGGRDGEHRLAIMRDVQVGTYGVVAILAVFGMKWAGMGSLPSDVRVETLLVVPCLARFAVVLAIAAFPYARPSGMGAKFHERAWPVPVVAAAATAAAASVVLLGPAGLAPVAFAAAVALAFGAWATRLAGGLTGDTYGATVEITEALSLLFIAALAERGWLEAWLLS